MAVPVPPPIERASSALYYPIDNDPYNMPDLGIICYLCANRMKEDYSRISLMNIICHNLCNSCEDKLDKLIVEIFGEGYESWDSNYSIKHINPHKIWHNRYPMGSHEFFCYIVSKTDEYRAYCEAAEALCIWNKPEVKL